MERRRRHAMHYSTRTKSGKVHWLVGGSVLTAIRSAVGMDAGRRKRGGRGRGKRGGVNIYFASRRCKEEERERWRDACYCTTQAHSCARNARSGTIDEKVMNEKEKRKGDRIIYRIYRDRRI